MLSKEPQTTLSPCLILLRPSLGRFKPNFVHFALDCPDKVTVDEGQVRWIEIGSKETMTTLN